MSTNKTTDPLLFGLVDPPEAARPEAPVIWIEEGGPPRGSTRVAVKSNTID